MELYMTNVETAFLVLFVSAFIVFGLTLGFTAWWSERMPRSVRFKKSAGERQKDENTKKAA